MKIEEVTKKVVRGKEKLRSRKTKVWQREWNGRKKDISVETESKAYCLSFLQVVLFSHILT